MRMEKEEGMVEVVNKLLTMDVFERRFGSVTLWNDRITVNHRDFGGRLYGCLYRQDYNRLQS
jgi:hypothetical protein